MGIDGEVLEFEWEKSTWFSTLTVLQQIQTDLQDKNIQPEKFEDRIILMLLFNDILWKTDDDNYISNAEKVKNYAKKFLPGHWMFRGPGSEKRWYGESHDQQGQWDRAANKMVQRGILKRRVGKSTIYCNGDSINTELLFQTIHSVNQISIKSVWQMKKKNESLFLWTLEHLPWWHQKR